MPAVLKAWRGVHEVIATIMMNFVAFNVSQFLVKLGGALVGEIPTGITVISGLVVACVAARLLLSRRAARSRQGELRA